MATLHWEGKCPGCTRQLVFELPAVPTPSPQATRYITRDAHFYTCACGSQTIIPAGMVDEPHSPTKR